MIDRELVTRKMVLISEDLRRLETLAAITESGEAPPRDYFESFVALSRIGALASDFAARLAPCAGLRNRIVHAYDDLDPGRVYDALRTALGDVPSYLAVIRRFLDTTVSGGRAPRCGRSSLAAFSRSGRAGGAGNATRARRRCGRCRSRSSRPRGA